MSSASTRVRAAESLFITAYGYNWDAGLGRLRRLLENEACDRATALLIYWMGRPGTYNAYADDAKVPAFARKELTLLRWIEKNIEEFPSVLAFDPLANTLFPPGLVPEERGRIPRAMYRSCRGRVRAEDVVLRGAAGDQLIASCREGRMRDVVAFCKRGLDVNESDSNGDLALHTAVEAGHVAITKYLLSQGADPARTTHSGSTALHIAFYKSRPAFELLLNAGVDIDLEGDDGSVLHDLVTWWSTSDRTLAARKKDLAYLLELGADPRKVLPFANRHRIKDVVTLLTASIGDKRTS